MTTTKLQDEILFHVRTRGGVHLSSPGELSAARALQRRGLVEIEDNGGAELHDGERWWVTPTSVVDDAVPTMPPPLDLSSLTARALHLHASALASVVASLSPDDDRTYRATARAELRRTASALLERGSR